MQPVIDFFENLLNLRIYPLFQEAKSCISKQEDGSCFKKMLVDWVKKKFHGQRRNGKLLFSDEKRFNLDQSDGSLCY